MNKQKTLSKSCKFEIKILASPGLMGSWLQRVFNNPNAPFCEERGWSWFCWRSLKSPRNNHSFLQGQIMLKLSLRVLIQRLRVVHSLHYSLRWPFIDLPDISRRDFVIVTLPSSHRWVKLLSLIRGGVCGVYSLFVLLKIPDMIIVIHSNLNTTGTFATWGTGRLTVLNGWPILTGRGLNPDWKAYQSKILHAFDRWTLPNGKSDSAHCWLPFTDL